MPVKIGRPTLLDDGITAVVCAALERGNTLKNAAQLAGISQATLHNWVAAAKKGSEIHQSFLERVRRAQAAAEDSYVTKIQGGAQGWQAAAWWLERRRRLAWRRPIQQIADGEKDLTAVPESELVHVLEVYAKQRRKTG